MNQLRNIDASASANSDANYWAYKVNCGDFKFYFVCKQAIGDSNIYAHAPPNSSCHLNSKSRACGCQKGKATANQAKTEQSKLSNENVNKRFRAYSLFDCHNIYIALNNSAKSYNS